MNPSAYFRSLGWARSSVALFGFGLVAFVGCTSDDPPSDQAEGDPADCRLIANRCHSYSAESDLANECHETGHDGADPARCTELKATCLATCPEREPDSGSGGSSGATSTGGAGGAAATGGSDTGGAGAASGGTAGESSAGAAGSAGTSAQGGASTGGAAGSGTGGQGGTSSGAAGMSGGAGASDGSGGTMPDGETPCEKLGRLCHGVGSGRPEECHEIGHDGDESVCEEELEDCLGVCTDGGT